MYVERAIKEDFLKRTKVYPIVALVGARQSGKTTFLKEHLKKDAAYVTFDDPDARAIFDEDIKKFELQYMSKNKLTVLDEAQYCADAGSKLKYLADKGYKIWLTSSSEILLKKEVISYLVGRVSIMKLYPMSIEEFISAKQIRALNETILKRAVWEHMTYGGYPKLVLTDDIELKKTIIKDLADTMILKDIARTFSVEDIKSLESFARYLAINTGSLISYNSISGTMNISFQTIKKYLNAMEKSYLVVQMQPFFRNKNKEITKQPKIYFVDTGMRNSMMNSFPVEPDGHLFENYVMSELLKAGFYPKFWRSKSKDEVDFIIEKGNEIIPIEVKINSQKGEVETGMRSFIREYTPKRGFIVYYKGSAKHVELGKCKISFVDIINLKKELGNYNQPS